MKSTSTAAVSSAIAAVFLLPGVYLLRLDQPVASGIGVSFTAFGAFVLIVGVYVEYRGSSNPPGYLKLEDLEETVEPRQTIALAKIALTLPVVLLSLYMILFTTLVYILSLAVLAVALAALSLALAELWSNEVTTYYLTGNRVVRVYSFLSPQVEQVSLNRLRDVRTTRSALQRRFHLQNIRVRDEKGSTELVLDDVDTFSQLSKVLRTADT